MLPLVFLVLLCSSLAVEFALIDNDSPVSLGVCSIFSGEILLVKVQSDENGVCNITEPLVGGDMLEVRDSVSEDGYQDDTVGLHNSIVLKIWDPDADLIIPFSGSDYVVFAVFLSWSAESFYNDTGNLLDLELHVFLPEEYNNCSHIYTPDSICRVEDVGYCDYASVSKRERTQTQSAGLEFIEVKGELVAGRYIFAVYADVVNQEQTYIQSADVIYVGMRFGSRFSAGAEYVDPETLPQSLLVTGKDLNTENTGSKWWHIFTVDVSRGEPTLNCQTSMDIFKVNRFCNDCAPAHENDTTALTLNTTDTEGETMESNGWPDCTFLNTQSDCEGREGAESHTPKTYSTGGTAKCYGDPHFITNDGKKFDIFENGTYNYFRSVQMEVDIQARLAHLKSHGLTYNGQVVIRVQSDVFRFGAQTDGSLIAIMNWDHSFLERTGVFYFGGYWALYSNRKIGCRFVHGFVGVSLDGCINACKMREPKCNAFYLSPSGVCSLRYCANPCELSRYDLRPSRGYQSYSLCAHKRHRIEIVDVPNGDRVYSFSLFGVDGKGANGQSHVCKDDFRPCDADTVRGMEITVATMLLPMDYTRRDFDFRGVSTFSSFLGLSSGALGDFDYNADNDFLKNGLNYSLPSSTGSMTLWAYQWKLPDPPSTRLLQLSDDSDLFGDTLNQLYHAISEFRVIPDDPPATNATIQAAKDACAILYPDQVAQKWEYDACVMDASFEGGDQFVLGNPVYGTCTKNCNNHGSCQAPNNTCICSPGFTGQFCDTPICECHNFGTCTKNGFCECPAGFGGPYCEEEVDCSNLENCHTPNGTCARSGVCECSDGYSGSHCGVKLADEPFCEIVNDPVTGITECHGSCPGSQICSTIDDPFLCYCMENLTISDPGYCTNSTDCTAADPEFVMCSVNHCFCKNAPNTCNGRDCSACTGCVNATDCAGDPELHDCLDSKCLCLYGGTCDEQNCTACSNQIQLRLKPTGSTTAAGTWHVYSAPWETLSVSLLEATHFYVSVEHPASTLSANLTQALVDALRADTAFNSICSTDYIDSVWTLVCPSLHAAVLINYNNTVANFLSSYDANGVSFHVPGYCFNSDDCTGGNDAFYGCLYNECTCLYGGVCNDTDCSQCEGFCFNDSDCTGGNYTFECVGNECVCMYGGVCEFTDCSGCIGFHVTADGCPRKSVGSSRQCTLDSTTVAVPRCCEKYGSGCTSDSCGGVMTYADAVDFCASDYFSIYRLCTEQELDNCCGSGCGYDDKRTWTLDRCEGHCLDDTGCTGISDALFGCVGNECVCLYGGICEDTDCTTCEVIPPIQTPVPTPIQSDVPTSLPTPVQTSAPPTLIPTGAPTSIPTQSPTSAPTTIPTGVPTQIPTNTPTPVETPTPTQTPTSTPTSVPTHNPTPSHTSLPTPTPTQTPTPVPTDTPTPIQTGAPTSIPTNTPTLIPTGVPTSIPSSVPTQIPTNTPTPVETPTPTQTPTSPPTAVPTPSPTPSHTALPTSMPTQTPTPIPTDTPTPILSSAPTSIPTNTPTLIPTGAPTTIPTSVPTHIPTNTPTPIPTGVPTSIPSSAPTTIPTGVPTQIPTSMPTLIPTGAPTSIPSSAPTTIPTGVPTQIPTNTLTPITTPPPTISPCNVTLMVPKPSGDTVDITGKYIYLGQFEGKSSFHNAALDLFLYHITDVVFRGHTRSGWVITMELGRRKWPYIAFLETDVPEVTISDGLWAVYEGSGDKQHHFTLEVVMIKCETETWPPTAPQTEPETASPTLPACSYLSVSFIVTGGLPSVNIAGFYSIHPDVNDRSQYYNNVLKLYIRYRSYNETFSAWGIQKNPNSLFHAYHVDGSEYIAPQLISGPWNILNVAKTDFLDVQVDIICVSEVPTSAPPCDILMTQFGGFANVSGEYTATASERESRPVYERAATGSALKFYLFYKHEWGLSGWVIADTIPSWATLPFKGYVESEATLVEQLNGVLWRISDGQGDYTNETVTISCN